MRSELLDPGPPEVHALVFDAAEEPVRSVTSWAEDRGVDGASFTGIGAFSRVALGYFDRARLGYERIDVDEQVEVVSLVGNVARAENHVKVHAHVVVARRDGTALGGHLLDASVWPTLELVLTENPGHLRRRHDPSTGLALLDLGSSSAR